MAVGSQELQFKIIAGVVGAQAVDAFTNTLKGLDKTATAINKRFDVLGQATKVLAGAFTVQQIGAFGKSLIDAADNLRNVSQATGITVKDLDGFKAAAAQADVPFESLTTSLARFAKNLVEAKNGNRDVSAAFKNLGVSISDADGKLRPTGDLIKAIADRFQGLKDGPEKAALAIKLFGKSGADLIPLLNEGSKSLSQFGLGFDDDFANRADQFNDTLTQIGDSLKRSTISALKELLPSLQDVANAFNNFGQSEDMSAFMSAIGEGARIAAIGFEALKFGIVNGIDVIIMEFRRLSAMAMDFGQDLVDAFQGAQIRITNLLNGDEREKKLAALNEAGLKRERDYNEKRIKLIEDFTTRSERRTQESVERIAKLKKNSLLLGDGTAEQITARVKKETAPPKRPTSAISANAEGISGSEQRDKVLEFIRLQQLEIDQRKDAMKDIGRNREELAKLTDQRKFDIELLRASNGLSAEQKAKLKEAALSLREQRQALIEMEEAQRRSFGAGAKQAFRDYIDAATDAAAQMKSLFSKAFQNMEDSLVNFVKTGTLDFKKFADDIITDLIRIQVRAAMAQAIIGVGSLFAAGPVANDFSGGMAGNARISPIMQAEGGVVGPSGSVSLKRYAAGGVANYPQMAVFGEGSRPEAYVPLPDGRTIPVTLEGKGSGSNVVNVSVNVQSGETSVQSQAESGRKLGSLIAQAVQQELIKQQRPGGILA